MKLLEFDFKMINAIVCLNGDIPESNFFKNMIDIPVIAADGGAIKLINIGIHADYVVGDLDSFLNYELSNKFNDTKIYYEPDQNSNDFEKAMNFSIQKGFNKILIVGINGGDYEHSLNNWSILMRYGKLVELFIYHSERIGIPIFNSIKFNCKENEIISLIPQPIAKLQTSGLKWELDCEYLELGKREGARNCALLTKIEINLLEGSYLLFKDA